MKQLQTSQNCQFAQGIENHTGSSACGKLLFANIQFSSVQIALAVFHVTGGAVSAKLAFHDNVVCNTKMSTMEGLHKSFTEVFDGKSESTGDHKKHHHDKGCCHAMLMEAEHRDAVAPPLKRKKA